MFREVKGTEIFKLSRDIVPENSRCINNCLFTRIGTHFIDMYRFCLSGVVSMYSLAYCLFVNHGRRLKSSESGWKRCHT